MRNLKVRAWDNVAFEMLYPGEEVDVIFVLDGTGIECTDLRNGTPSGTGIDSMDHLIYMQYTGLKDKNDKEIYEGDVIKWGGGKTESRSKMQVVWANEHAQYILLAFQEDWCYELGGCLQDTLEIIGNIYKNPELLEEQK